MPNGKMQCPGIRCVILIQTLLKVLKERRQYKENEIAMNLPVSFIYGKLIRSIGLFWLLRDYFGYFGYS